MSPDGGLPDSERRIHDAGDSLAQCILADEPFAYVAQFLVGSCVFIRQHALQSGIGAQTIQTKQQAALQGRAIHDLARAGTMKRTTESDTQIRFLEYIEQTGRRPAFEYLCFQMLQVRWIGLCVKRREANAVLAGRAQRDARILWQALIQPGQCIRHRLLDTGHEQFDIRRLAQCFIVGLAPVSEIRGQVIVRIAVAFGTDHPYFLALQPLAQ